MPAPAACPPAALPDPAALLHDLLAVSLTAVNLLRPRYGPDGPELVDFSLDYLNPAAQRITGLPERPAGTATSHFPAILTNGVFAFYRRVFETGEAGRYDFNYQADGFDNYFHVAARRSGDLLVVSFTDTADHDRSPVELALRASQAAERAARAEAEAERQRFYEVLRRLPAQVATYQGPDHVYQFVNPRYQRYFPTQALLGRSIREVIPEVGEQGIFALLDGVYQTGEPYTSQEVEAWIDFSNTGHREQVFLNLFFYPLRDAQGRVDGVLDFSYDVTEQVRARRRVRELNQARQASNDELAAANRQLTRTNVDLDNFIYTASHDLKQPIANIEGLLDALGEHLPAAARQVALVPRLLALMRQDVERFQLTLHQLTDLTRLQQAHAAPAEAVDLAATVEAVRLDLAPLLAGARLSVDVAPGLRVHCAPPNLRSVVYNLLSNALKYRDPERPAAVQPCAHAAAAGAVLEVQDNGLGLDEGQQGRLFGMFQRLHDHVEGSGIGLCMVKRILENAGGTIAVRSQAGVGSTFTVTFPA